MIMTATQTLGIVDDLIADKAPEAFAYPEAATVTTLLSDDTTERNYVLQGSGLSVRQARRAWVLVPTADMHVIRGYDSGKDQVVYSEEDGTDRLVVVMDFSARERFTGYWDVSVRLIETADPDTPGS